MRLLLILILFVCAPVAAQQHCGYDFTSYVVLHIHENGKTTSIPDLKVTLIDSTGAPAINTDNKYSWNNGGKTLHFYENYRIDNSGARVEENTTAKWRWHFPYAKDTYILSVTNEFPADGLSVLVEDVSPNPIYKPTTVALHAYNLYVLCSSQQEAMQFGRRINKPVDIVLEKL